MSLLKVHFKTSRHDMDILLIDVLAFYSPSFVCEFYSSFLDLGSVNFNDLGVLHPPSEDAAIVTIRMTWLTFFSWVVSRWVFPKIGVPQNGWFIKENPVKMDDLGGKPLFSETSRYIFMFIPIQTLGVSWSNLTLRILFLSGPKSSE